MAEKAIFETLRKYITATSLFYRENPYDENTFDVFQEKMKESIAAFCLNDQGDLQAFSQFAEEEGELTKEQAVQLAEQFINDFYASISNEIFCTLAFDFDEFYLIEYVQRDEKYQLDLPNSGITFHIYKNGMISHVTCNFEQIEVVYPEKCLMPLDAKKLLLQQTTPTLQITRSDHEVYVNGDEQYKVVYNFIENVPADVKMDGSLTMLSELGQVEHIHHKLEEEVEAFSETPIFFGNDYSYVLEKVTDEGIIQAWKIDDDAEEVNADELTSLDWGTDGYAKRLICSTTNRIIKYLYEPTSTASTIDETAAYRSAIRYLNSAFPSIWSSFQWREEEAKLYSYDDDGENEYVYAYRFQFDFFIGGIEVREQTATLVIGAAEGELIQYEAPNCLPVADEKSFFAQATVEQAIETYEQFFTMELHWAKTFDNETDAVEYELVYVQEFEGTGGHIHFIDANTLVPWIVRVE